MQRMLVSHCMAISRYVLVKQAGFEGSSQTYARGLEDATTVVVVSEALSRKDYFVFGQGTLVVVLINYYIIVVEEVAEKADERSVI